MFLAEHRDILSGWLQDQGIQWPQVRLNRTINLAIRETEKHILMHDPESFKWIYTASTTVPSEGKDNFYSYPVGTFAVHELALSADGVNYVPLRRLTLSHVRKCRELGITDRGFVPYDAKTFIGWPSATTVIAAGVRAIVAPTLGMTDDNDECPLPLAFETLMMLEAKKIALWDVGEPTDSVQSEINRYKEDTPRFFLTPTEPAFISPVIDRGY
jgi:hypothetical protein